VKLTDAGLEYHLEESRIALDPTDPRHSIPSIPQGTKRVLDVGCGIGQTLAALRVSQHVELHGVDIDARAIEYGHQCFPQLHLQVATGERLPYADASFDMLLCRVALPYMHIPSALREFSRVMSDSGTLWITLHSLTQLRADMMTAMRARSVRALVYRGYAVVNSGLLLFGKQAHYPLNRARIESYQVNFTMRRALRHADFHDVQIRRERHSTVATAIRARRE
jgi:ubiquinone/menaquinone biosynthesis C-methylase UbiE